MALEATLIIILVLILAFIISALPLHFAVVLLGGKTNIIKTGLIVLISGIVVTLIKAYLNWYAGLIAFIVVIWLYHEVFRLKWFKAIFAWLLQFVFVILLGMLFSVIFGISIAALL